MEEQSLLFHIGPIWFDGTVAVMSALVCVKRMVSGVSYMNFL